MSDSYTNLLYHIVFSTKDRRPLIKPEYEPRLYEYIGGTIRGLGGVSLELNGTEDHVHLLAKLRPDRALSDVLRKLKANASGWMHDVFPAVQDFSWQRGYGAFTVSQSGVEEVRNYLRRQKEHHAKFSIRDEFIQFLKVNGIEYDERYVWSKVYRPLRGLRLFSTAGPGVSLRSTPGFMPTPAPRVATVS
jgi:putative transposase